MEVEGTASGYFSEATEETQLDQEPLKRCTGDSDTTSQPPLSASGCFDCNICFEFAGDPVVTLCGHLYCWPCIYKWLQVESDSPQQCPVCKASLSQNTLVPLYGRGQSTKRSQQSIDIPRRPSSSVHHRDPTVVQPPQYPTLSEEEPYTDIHPIPVHRHRHQHYHVHQHEHHHFPQHGYSSGEYLSPVQPSSPLGTTRVIHSTAGGVLGGMAIAVLPWVFRNHQEAMTMHYASPYYVGPNGGSPRLRRQEMEVESSLHQIWLFFFCCAILCLLLF